MVNSGRGVHLTLVATVAAVVALVGYAVLRFWVGGGHSAPQVSWGGAVLLLAMAVGVYVVGVPVRRYRLGRPNAKGRRPMTALRAWRTLVLAQAAALTGAAATGWYVAQGLILLPNLDVPTVRGQGLRVAALTAGSMAIVAAGLMVQRMCRLDGDDDAR
jgi:MFS family permease